MKEATLVFVAVFAVTLASFRITRAATRDVADHPFEPLWALDLHGCSPIGDCTPGIFVVPSGRYRFLRCTDGGWCTLVSYQWWDPRDARGWSGGHAWEKKESRR